MIHLATALIALGDTSAAETLGQRLTAKSYTCTLTTTGDTVVQQVADTRPDVLILGPGLGGPSQSDLVRALRDDPRTCDVPIFYLSPIPLAESGDHLLACGVDDATFWPCHPDLIVARIRPLVRVATMRTELRQRSTVLEARGSLVPPEMVQDETRLPASILVIGEGQPDQMVAQAMPDAELVIAPDLVEAQRLMDERLFDAAVMAPQGNTQAYLDLCLQIRRNARLFNLPVVFLTPPETPTDQVVVMAMGASSALTGSPAIAELRFTLRVLVRRQRLRWALRRSLGGLLGGETAAPDIPVVYSRLFLEDCLRYRLSTDRGRMRRFSLIGFAFAGVDAIRHEFGEESEQSLLVQIGQWLTLLVRAEDMVAAVSGSQFVVLLPDTPLSEAQVVMHRIAGVISNTEFAAKDVYRVVTVWPFVNATEVQTGDTCEAVLARAAATIGEGMAPW